METGGARRTPSFFSMRAVAQRSTRATHRNSRLNSRVTASAFGQRMRMIAMKVPFGVGLTRIESGRVNNPRDPTML